MRDRIMPLREALALLGLPAKPLTMAELNKAVREKMPRWTPDNTLGAEASNVDQDRIMFARARVLLSM